MVSLSLRMAISHLTFLFNTDKVMAKMNLDLDLAANDVWLLT